MHLGVMHELSFSLLLIVSVDCSDVDYFVSMSLLKFHVCRLGLCNSLFTDVPELRDKRSGADVSKKLCGFFPFSARCTIGV